MPLDLTDEEIENLDYDPEVHKHAFAKTHGSKYKCAKCGRIVVPGSEYCWQHGGNRTWQKIKEESLRNYRLAKWHSEISRHSSSSEIKNLRDEVGILRMLLENMLNQIDSTADLMMAAAGISDLVLKVERVVRSCHQMEDLNNEMIHRSDAINIAHRIIGIIGDYVSDATHLEELSFKIAEAFDVPTD